MQRSAQQDSTCPNCGGVLEKTPSGELGCMSCLLGMGISSEEETVHDETLSVAAMCISNLDCAALKIQS